MSLNLSWGWTKKRPANSARVVPGRPSDLNRQLRWRSTARACEPDTLRAAAAAVVVNFEPCVARALRFRPEGNHDLAACACIDLAAAGVGLGIVVVISTRNRYSAYADR